MLIISLYLNLSIYILIYVLKMDATLTFILLQISIHFIKLFFIIATILIYSYLPSYASHNLFCSAPILNISCKSLTIASTLASICSTVPVRLPAEISH